MFLLISVTSKVSSISNLFSQKWKSKKKRWKIHSDSTTRKQYTDCLKATAMYVFNLHLTEHMIDR